MFKEQMNKIKSLIIKDTKENNVDKKNKRKIENLVFFLVVLIVTLIVINTILKDDKKGTNTKEDTLYKELAQATEERTKSDNDELEKKLQDILETMTGVRKSKGSHYIFKIK
ncbi:MAG: hypothetical protein HFJ54_03565 [Clostridia bacterium]|nr:hypothetical protein [Clostridia bacterium]